jgi:signal peptidase I
MAQKADDPATARPVRPPAGGWLRIAIIGRNPKVTIVRIAVLVVVCVVVFNFILLPVRVQGISMLPTYKDKKANFINRLAYLQHGPRRGDVVGLRLSTMSTPYHAPGVMYLKRVVGLPGETVAFAHGRLLIDGTALDEPYVKAPCNWNSAPVTVGPNQYYVVGDNRSMAQEDHEHGRAEKEQIVGKVLF